MNWDPEGFAEMIVGTIKKALLGPLVAGRLAALEQRIAALEGTPFLRFAGPYSADSAYAPGDVATSVGGLWCCTCTTSGSFDPTCWTLMVRRGRPRDDR